MFQGMLFLRDYAEYDEAMLRFSSGSKVAERLYVRGVRHPMGTSCLLCDSACSSSSRMHLPNLLSLHAQDGTRAYFFTRTELMRLAQDAGFVKVEVLYRKKTIVNRKQQYEMKRNWIELRAFLPSSP